MRTQDEHTKLARAALEFWPDLDEAFEINISKMRVRLPIDLRDQLERPVSDLIKRAQERYRGGEKTASTRGRPPAPRASANLPTMDPPLGYAPPRSEDGHARSTGPADVSDSGRAAVTPSADDDARPRARLGNPYAVGERATEPFVVGTSSVAAALQRSADRIGQNVALDLIREELCRSEPEVAHELGW